MAGKYKAKILEISKVDSGGNVEILYQIIKDKEIVYDNLRITATPIDYKENIARKAIDLVNTVKQAESIKVPEIIDLD